MEQSLSGGCAADQKSFLPLLNGWYVPGHWLLAWRRFMAAGAVWERGVDCMFSMISCDW